jgi:hypothetical protein
MKKLAAALLIAMVPAPALAEGAFAIGNCDHGYPYSYSWNHASKAAARQIALAYCARHGSNCRIVNDDLNRLCFAFAVDKSQECGPYGLAYYSSLAQTKQEAIATCQQYGGKDCRILVAQCDRHRQVVGAEPAKWQAESDAGAEFSLRQ